MRALLHMENKFLVHASPHTVPLLMPPWTNRSIKTLLADGTAGQLRRIGRGFHDAPRAISLVGTRRRLMLGLSR